MRTRLCLIAKVVWGGAIAIAVIGIVALPASAQQNPAASLTAAAPSPASVLPGGLQVAITPYLWLPGLDMTITTPLQRASEIDISAGAAELLGDLSGIPVPATVEIRAGPLSILGDIFHIPLGVGVTTRNIFFNGGTSSITENIGTAVFLYHAVEQPLQSIDAGAGFRSWGVSTVTTLNPGILPGTSVTASGGWTDPLIAARYHRDFGNGFGLTAYGDLGGFDLNAHYDWQIIGSLDYAWKPWVSLHLGYRSLNVTYQATNSPIGFNVHMKGPILAATFRF